MRAWLLSGCLALLLIAQQAAAQAVRAGGYWNCVSSAYNLAGLGRADAVPDLIGRLADEDTDVQVGVAEALGLLGPSARAALPALRRLLEAEEFPHKDTVGEAIARIERGD